MRGPIASGTLGEGQDVFLLGQVKGTHRMERNEGPKTETKNSDPFWAADRTFSLVKTDLFCLLAMASMLGWRHVPGCDGSCGV